MDSYIKSKFKTSILNDLAKTYHITTSELKYVDSFESFLYRYQKNSKNYYLRISHSQRREPDQIRGELDWIQHLHQFHLPIIEVAPTPTGEQMVIIPIDDNNFFTAVSFKEVKGTHLRDAWETDEYIIQLGTIIARMHEATKSYQPVSNARTRMTWYDEIISYSAKYLSPTEPIIDSRFHEIIERINQIPKHPENYGLIHYDLHRGNLFFDQGQIRVLDFDDCVYHYFVTDLAIALFYAVPFDLSDEQRDQSAKRFIQLLMKGYEQIRPLTEEETKLIPLFLKLREIDLYLLLKRSYGEGPYDAWSASYLQNRKERIEQNIPFFSESIFEK